MRRSILILSLLILSLKTFSQQNFNKQNAAAEAFIQQTIKNLNITGLAVAVVKDGKVIKMSNYGTANYDWKIPVNEHTNFQIASTSKLLATTLAMKCIHNKTFTLDDEVAKFIDTIPDAWKGMKIRHLLNHSSGIKVIKQNKYVTIANVVKSLKDSTLVFPYGTQQAYASGDFTLLQYIFEKIYKKPYPEIIKQEITGPMKMRDGAFDREKLVSEWMETDIVNNKAITYYVKEGKLTPYKYFYPEYTYTAGGYFASISDMANWAINMDKYLLFPKAIEMEFAYPADTINGKISGFSKVGWGSGKPNGIWIGGHSGGPALGDVLRIPEKGFTFIVLSNDGELLPYFAPALATFYVNGLPFKREVTKFKRTKAL